MANKNELSNYTPEAQESTAIDQDNIADTQELTTRLQRDSIIRLVRLGKNFNRVAAQSEVGRQGLREHHELVELLRRQDPGSVTGRY
ncbi:MAG TPA: hypothetical protein VFN31_01110 [Candidatus Saccharimonadales bacterium]|nr:hypothetical protein [Candidatus Saccharimonadales bacterium]